MNKTKIKHFPGDDEWRRYTRVGNDITVQHTFISIKPRDRDIISFTVDTDRGLADLPKPVYKGLMRVALKAVERTKPPWHIATSAQGTSTDEVTDYPQCLEFRVRAKDVDLVMDAIDKLLDKAYGE